MPFDPNELRRITLANWADLNEAGHSRRIVNLLLNLGEMQMTAFDDLHAMIAGVRGDAAEVVRLVEALVAAKDDPSVSDAEVLAMVDELRGVRQSFAPLLELDVPEVPTGPGTTDPVTPQTDPDPDNPQPGVPTPLPDGGVVDPNDPNVVIGPDTTPPAQPGTPVDSGLNPQVDPQNPPTAPVTTNPQDGQPTDVPPPVNG